MEHYKDIKAIHMIMLEGKYKSKRFKNPVFSYGWDQELAVRVCDISEKRATNRVNNYVLVDELERVKPRIEEGKDFSLRFGKEKKGKGNFGARGDFCLLGASYTKAKGGTFTMFYRSLELFGGLVYDQAIIDHVQDYLELPIRTIVVMAGSCHSFALKGNSNEKLWSQLQDIYQEF